METSSPRFTTMVAKQSRPSDGAKLLSIIDRLSDKNLNKFSPNDNRNSDSDLLWASSENQNEALVMSGVNKDGNGHECQDTANHVTRKSRKGRVGKLRKTLYTMSASRPSDVETNTRSPYSNSLLASAGTSLESTTTTNRFSAKGSTNIILYGENTTPCFSAEECNQPESHPNVPQLPSNLKLTIINQASNEREKPALCLCKPASPKVEGLTVLSNRDTGQLSKYDKSSDHFAASTDIDHSSHKMTENVRLSGTGNTSGTENVHENMEMIESAELARNGCSTNACLPEDMESVSNACSTNTCSPEKAKSIPNMCPADTPCLAENVSSKSRLWVCSICVKEFGSVDLLESHQKEKGHYLCGTCGEAFHEPASFHKHVELEQCKVLPCFICRMKFASEDDLDWHKIKEHRMCVNCDKCFINDEKLLKHQTSCRGPQRCYTCNKCAQAFLSHSRYKTHMMSAHIKEKPVMSAHTKEKPAPSHSKEKRYTCPQCGKGFVRTYALNTHIESMHVKEKKFECEFCQKMFKRKDHLKIHMFTHYKEKPWNCESCGKGFNQKVCLTRHLPCRIIMQHKPLKIESSVNNKTPKTNQNPRASHRQSKQGGGKAKKLHSKPNVEPTTAETALQCSCTADCHCKKFSLGVGVHSKQKEGVVKELGVVSCCCDVEIKEVVSKNDHNPSDE